MGFFDYAWMISLQKDNAKVKILLSNELEQPTLESDNFGFTVTLPTPQIDNGKISFLGMKFTKDFKGKSNVGRLFRASVTHLMTHTLTPLTKEKAFPNTSDSVVKAFSKSVIRDTYVNVYLKERYPDRLADLAYANSTFFLKIKPLERIFSMPTRIMTAVLSKVNIGIVNGSFSPDAEKTLNKLITDLTQLKEKCLAAIKGEKINLEQCFSDTLQKMEEALEPYGPFIEAPSLRYTEQIGRCSIYREVETPSDVEFERIFKTSIETLGGAAISNETFENYWRKEENIEASQALDSELYQNERREKILAKIRDTASSTNFKSIVFPEEDYTQYLRAKSLVQGASRRLLDILRGALDMLDEDPRQEMGQLDLAAVIQAMASNKPATDVFFLEENLKQSFAWSIVFDASKSMNVKGEFTRALAIAVAEAAKEMMTDPTSWTFFAFNDRLYVIKASNESYSKTVRARIGGLKFDGLTFMPDAIQVAGKMLAKRFEEQRCLVVISDGWPYGYANVSISLKNTVEDLLKKGVIVIGIGVETDRMGNFFKLNASIHHPKDLIKKFGHTFVESSGKALDS